MKHVLINKIGLDHHKKSESLKKDFVLVNHICIQEDSTIFNDILLPFGSKEIEEKETFIIDEILHNIIHILMSEENKNKEIIICSTPKVKRIFGRKLEDRLRREISY
ncbi:MAG: hypothetical protein KBD12_00225 [Candidatus Pacebacteria bacterium]|nr:hypothetical protein [Candidatus Paceibacterota bacterium]